MTEQRRKRIVITGREHGLPYSKGLTASTLMLTGLGPARSYAVANKVEEELNASAGLEVSDERLTEITLEVLRREAGER
jgi:2-phosphoglycerate kinase